ncbi:TPA: hypothetical protein OUI97_001278 [Pseudomonas aeruginosa]|uniref:hypothetical protein n=2 Tax=Pseudomonas aeruginosa TaxID=287 RepID=UPI000AF9DA1B|nr:hypothetical protein [Pseudomonas aeruginosa]MBW8258949.1 hypothetical protein [Pseudomonas aeruginosa]MBW8275045.1 hypothetical protein [Pseudomonas aeruginosa]MBX6759132.1 hypothetical protein [Pseudomonas aeruginosa]MCR6602074.1 hypothetical protein [Pseudomonas aeruginosa]MCT4505924.1 hypothetical protein [Pseudomonas aeruginosa]
MIKNDSQTPLCTCPSGNGSLRHPCPAHPTGEQVGGDERAAFEAAYQTEHAGFMGPLKLERREDGEYKSEHVGSAWRMWQARAALAQPSPAQAEQPAADYEEVLAHHRGLVRKRRMPLLSRSQAEDAPVIGCLCGMPMTEGHHSPDGCSSLGEFARHVVVPREVLKRSIDRWACCAMSQTPGAEEAWEELRALLSQQEGGSDHA